jgi:hypothetical protein
VSENYAPEQLYQELQATKECLTEDAYLIGLSAVGRLRVENTEGRTY